MRTISRLILRYVLVCCIVSPVWAAEFPRGEAKPLASHPRVQKNPVIQNIEFAPSRIILEAHERQQLNNATKQLINQNFANTVNSSISVLPRVTVRCRQGNKILAEALVVFRAKDTYTARISRLEYDVQGPTSTLRNKVDDYVPRVEPLRMPCPPGPVTIQVKRDLIANPRIPLPQGSGPLALANTPCTEFPSAVSSTNNIHTTFTSAFVLAEKKIGSESTKAALMDALMHGTRLLAWNNISHGNPTCIVQWNDEPIWFSDFNSATTFSGIYDAVIMLTASNTCASSFDLKKAIMRHHPRTYIAGNQFLPIGRADNLAADFWKYVLQDGMPMGTALASAQNAHGLSGYYCLNGYDGKFSEVAAEKLTEDCFPFDPARVEVAYAGRRWLVVSGTQPLLDCSSRSDVAKRATEIIRYYKLDKQCFVGRPPAAMMYFSVHGQAPQGPFPDEDATAFNPANVTAVNLDGSWMVVDGPLPLLDFGPMEAQARTAVEIIETYGFTHLCFVGRPNAPMMYFRK